MMRSLAPDRARATLAVVAAVIVMALPTSVAQIGAIVLGAIVGLVLFRGTPPADHVSLPHPVSRGAAVTAIVIFFAILIALPFVVAARAQPCAAIVRRVLSRRFAGFRRRPRRAALAASRRLCRRAGSATMRSSPAMARRKRCRGRFSRSPPIWARSWDPAPNGWLGAILCLIAMFLPAFLLVIGPLPFWDELRRRATAQGGLRGVNAAVVGLAAVGAVQPGLDLRHHQCG